MTYRSRSVLLLLAGSMCVPAFAASDPWGDSPFTLRLGAFGYSYYRYDLESEKNDARGEFTYRFGGPSLYLGFAFR